MNINRCMFSLCFVALIMTNCFHRHPLLRSFSAYTENLLRVAVKFDAIHHAAKDSPVSLQQIGDLLGVALRG